MNDWCQASVENLLVDLGVSSMFHTEVLASRRLHLRGHFLLDPYSGDLSWVAVASVSRKRSDPWVRLLLWSGVRSLR